MLCSDSRMLYCDWSMDACILVTREMAVSGYAWSNCHRGSSRVHRVSVIIERSCDRSNEGLRIQHRQLSSALMQWIIPTSGGCT
jgi:hypothetical protein